MNDGGGRKRNKRRRRGRQSRPTSSMPNHAIGGTVRSSHAHMPHPVRSDGSIDPFALFCALHLSIGADDNYQPMGIPGVARRFGVDARVVRDALRDYCLDNESLRRNGYRLDWARIDARVVPDGISRTEVARMHWNEFLETVRDERDWDAILSVPPISDEIETPDEDELVDDEDDGEDEAAQSADSDEGDDDVAPSRPSRGPEPSAQTERLFAEVPDAGSAPKEAGDDSDQTADEMATADAATSKKKPTRKKATAKRASKRTPRKPPNQDEVPEPNQEFDPDTD